MLFVLPTHRRTALRAVLVRINRLVGDGKLIGAQIVLIVTDLFFLWCTKSLATVLLWTLPAFGQRVCRNFLSQTTNQSNRSAVLCTAYRAKHHVNLTVDKSVTPPRNERFFCHNPVHIYWLTLPTKWRARSRVGCRRASGASRC